MGAQIAQVFAVGGFSVLAYDVDNETLDRGLSLIRKGRFGLENSIAKGKITSESAKKILESIEVTSSIEYALAGAGFVLEAAVEDLAIKQEIMKKASHFATKDAILATNTSTLSISKISESLSAQERNRVVGMHFFNPPQIMRLVEVVTSKETMKQVAVEVGKISEKIGKVAVFVVDYPGFVANRIGISVFAEASDLLQKGIASVRDIDISMRLGYGYPLGPFELGDLVGLDARLRNMEALYEETKEERFRPPEILKKLVDEGYLGDPKSKKGSKGGYYEYFGLKKPDKKD